MTIIIPYRDEVHSGLELKFALRSIEKNLTGWTGLLLIGDPPAWFKGDSITFRDLPGRKEFNIYSKILAACNDKRVSEDFLMWNDDHYLLAKIRINDIKYWHTGNIRRGAGSYKAKLLRTTLLFPGSNFDIHVPIIYNKEKFKSIFAERKDEICIKSAYCNSLGIEGEFMNDCKVDGQLPEISIRQAIHGRVFFSTGTMLCKGVVKVLESLFPKKSQWEKS